MTQEFIYTELLEDISICDRLIEHHNKAEKHLGVTASIDGNFTENKEIKDSEDCYLDSTMEMFHEYGKAIQKVTNNYIAKFPFSAFYSPWGIAEKINIQKYPENGGYKKWHTERIGAQGLVGTRHLVFMTYLNDVELGGETEFFHQQLKIKPQKGLSVIFPAEWTFTHRGIPAPNEIKYIVTGWYGFVI